MLRWGEDEHEATVSVPPNLLIWADPPAALGRFLHMGTGEMAPPPIPAEPPLALWLAESGAPAPARLAAMVALARDERGRLEE